jgi:hypothetical protein
MPDPLLGLRPPELCSSRVAVRRLQRLSPLVVRRDRRACLSGGIRRAPNPNAETMEPVVQRRTPSTAPRCRSSAARCPTPVGSPEFRLPPPKRQRPFLDTRAPNPVSRYRSTVTRSSTPDAPREAVARCRSNAPQSPETRSSAPPWVRRKRRAHCRTPADTEHRIPSAETPSIRRNPNTEAPGPLCTRAAEAPRIRRARDTEVPRVHRARAT